MTRRDAVAEALGAEGTFRSAQEIYGTLRRAGHKVGLATVYRHLQALADLGLADVLRTDLGETVYRQCTSGRHHHHLVCRSCGRTIEVAGSAVERWAAQVAAKHGFTDVRHDVEVYGRCPDCAESATGLGTAAP